MNDRTLCSDCHSPLTIDAVNGLCPRCARNRRITGSPQRLGWLVLLLGGGWTLFWTINTARFIYKANLEPGVGGEYAGYAVMGVMLAVPGLVVTLVGIRLVWPSQRSLGTESDATRASETGSRGANTLASAALAMGVLGFMFAPVLGPAAVLCGVLALVTPDIDARSRSMAWGGVVIGAAWTVFLVVPLLLKYF